MADSDSSGTLSSAGGDDLDEDDNFEPPRISGFKRDSILGGKLQQNRRLSTASSMYNYSEQGGWADDMTLGLMDDDNKSNDEDSDQDGDQLDVEQLLEQEHEKLQFFDESLNQCNKLASKMTGVLQNLQDKLKKLQTTLDPIRKDTTEVATAEKNINRTMSELRKVMEYHALTTEPLDQVRKKTLKASSGLVGNANTNNNNNNNETNAERHNMDKEFDTDEWNDPFLLWIEKINEARNYFEENKFKSSDKAIANLKNIAKIALSRMEDYFRDLLKQHTTRNKRVVDEIVGYPLPDNWKERNASFPLWTNKLLNRKNKKNKRSYHQQYDKEDENKDEQETDLLYIPYNVIKLLANVASRIEQTATCHGLPDHLAKLVIAPRSSLLLDILESLDDERLLTIMYIHAYYEQALKNKATNLFNKKVRVKEVKRSEASNEINEDGARNSVSLLGDEDLDDNDQQNNQQEEEKKAHAPEFGVLSADALDQLNTMNALEHDPDEDIIASIVNIDIKKISHPIILLLHIGLSLFQLERHLCSTILDVKNEVLLEFDEFFNEVIATPLQSIVRRVENVLKVKDIMDVERNAAMNTKGRRVSFNQVTNVNNPSIPMEEAARITAKSTAKAAIINDSIHKNIVLVKLDLVATWMKLYPVFDRVLNQSQDYGANDDDEEALQSRRMTAAHANGDMNGHGASGYSSSQRGMVHLAKLGEKLYLNCHETLETRIVMIKNHKEIKNIRVDGGYHPLTIETVNLMYGIYELRDALQHLYESQKSLSPMMKILIHNEDEEKANAHDGNAANIMEKQQIEKTLIAIVSALRLNLKQKSAQFAHGGNKRSSLEAVFMINNLHYIVRKIADTELETACGQDVLKSLRKDILKWKQAYEKATWDKIKEYIDISKLRDDYFTDKTTNLTTKDKKPIKTRYAGFNKEFQEQLDTQKYFSVPDATLRQELIQRNIDIVLPMYRIFVAKFKNIEFTKDRGKYHKYEEKVLYEKMQQFFQQQ